MVNIAFENKAISQSESGKLDKKKKEKEKIKDIEIGPLQVAIHVVQNHYAGEQKSH